MRRVLVIMSLAILFVIATPTVHAKSVPSTNSSQVFTTSGTHTKSDSSAKHQSTPVSTAHSSHNPAAIVVACWLPHDVELWNNDGEWCINGSKYINFYNVWKITNTHGSTIIISDNTIGEDITMSAGETLSFNADEIVYIYF